MSDRVIVISGRVVALAALIAALAALVLVLALPGPREALATRWLPEPTPDLAALERQRSATEQSLQRGYTKALEQLRRVRALTLPVSAAEADAIHSAARSDLIGIRRQALAAVGATLALSPGDVEAYVMSAEARLDRQGPSGEPGILLAPALFDIVRRADALFATTADDATRRLTRPAQSPVPSAAPAAPSPTGR